MIMFSKSLTNRKKPEPQFVISAPAPEDNLISILAPQHWFQPKKIAKTVSAHNQSTKVYLKFQKELYLNIN
jgi:hypothetical protein